jgi:hypothetical protein
MSRLPDGEECVPRPLTCVKPIDGEFVITGIGEAVEASPDVD